MTRAACLILAIGLMAAPPATAEQGPLPLAPGPRTCLAPDGGPAFAFAILDDGLYGDPGGAEGQFTQPGPGMIAFVTGPWAGSRGSTVPGMMALMLPGAKIPVLCRDGG
jgi:hypothetical protein